jgi:biopolymer transport protein ExbB/TolQ
MAGAARWRRGGTLSQYVRVPTQDLIGMPFSLPQSGQLADWLQFLSRLSTPVIAGLAVVHVLVFLVLRIWCNRDLRLIAGTLDDYTRGLKFRSVLGRASPLPAQIDAFVQDVHDVLSDPSRAGDRAECLRRMHVLEEKRPYLESLSFETATHSARTMIEAYPLCGVLGTVLAIGSALQSETVTKTPATVNLVMERFGDSIWSTFAGLLAAIVLMFINSVLEIRFNRLTECRQHVRDMIALTKRELGLAARSGGEPA